jgi:hypothetical protein
MFCAPVVDRALHCQHVCDQLERVPAAQVAEQPVAQLAALELAG